MAELVRIFGGVTAPIMPDGSALLVLGGKSKGYAVELRDRSDEARAITWQRTELPWVEQPVRPPAMISAEAIGQADAFLSTHNPSGRPVVVIYPMTAHSLRQWPEPRFLDLAKYLRDVCERAIKVFASTRNKRKDTSIYLHAQAFLLRMPRAYEIAQKLIAKFPEIMRYTRQQLNFWKDFSWHMTIGHARDWLAIHNTSTEVLEGVQAFQEKRQPDYAALHAQAEEDRSPEYPHGAPTRSCPHCGAQNLPAQFEFCGKCGGKLS